MNSTTTALKHKNAFHAAHLMNLMFTAAVSDAAMMTAANMNPTLINLKPKNQMTHEQIIEQVKKSMPSEVEILGIDIEHKYPISGNNYVELYVHHNDGCFNVTIDNMSTNELWQAITCEIQSEFAYLNRPEVNEPVTPPEI